MKKIYLIILFIAQITFSQAQITTPKEHFGYAIGDDYHLANFTQTEAYFKKIAKQSDRIRYKVIGKTEEGREQPILIISAPENLTILDHYQSIAQKLARAELPETEAKKLAKEGKSVVWIDGGLHSTETVAMHQLIQIAYLLASQNDDETKNILQNCIVLLTHANPDGQELVSNWYMRESVPEKRSLANLPKLYQKYAGHDNNRDFFMLNLKESQNIAKQLFIEWNPQIMYNHHQTAPAGAVVAGAP
ncbi:MAG TPA: M14 family zinc carboxypeptidase, partial [Sphingobacterium bovisgrunnientis]|nr:M14 family zinc carboxypeptidase [Sphingobacterium bovisgrunnientis]